MPETFVPLVSTTAPRAATFNSLSATRTSAANGQADSADKCGKPTVTLQKNGDVVSVIRVQCGCGQVTELNCVY